MFVNQQTSRLEFRYGRPINYRSEWEMTESEFNLVKASMLSGRQHDITLLIFQHPLDNMTQITSDSQLVVIRKPYYQPNTYRLPSGGIIPGEIFEFGVKREAQEETGLFIKLHFYLLKARVGFTYRHQQIEWQTHVFTASTSDKKLCPTDTNEIASARWVSWGELGTNLLKSLQKSPSVGLRYRAGLQKEILKYQVKRIPS